MKKKNLLKTASEKSTTKLCYLIILAIMATSAILPGQTTSYRFSVCSAGTAANNHTGSCSGDDVAKGITLDGKGNSYVVGTFAGTATFGSLGSLTSLGANDIFIEKINSVGTYKWVAQGKGSGDDDVKSVTVYPDGAGALNTYVTGFFTGSIIFTSSGTSTVTVTVNTASGNAGDQDMFIVKYNSLGIVQWAMDCGSTTTGNLTIGWDIAVNNNGSGISIWVAGSFTGTTSFGTGYSLSAGAGNQNGFLACYADGSTAPSGVTWAVAITSTNTCQAIGVDADDNGNAYLTGYFLGSTTATFSRTNGGSYNITPYGSDDGFVARYDGSGGMNTTTSPPVHFGRTAFFIFSGTSGEGIAVAKDGSVYVVGAYTGTATFPNSTSLTSAGGEDGFLMKLNNAINSVTWLDSYGGSTGDDDAERVVVDNCGKRCYLAGDFQGTANFGSISLTSTGNVDAFVADFDASTGLAIHVDHVGSGSGVSTDAFAFDVAVNSVEDIQYCGSFSSSSLLSPLLSWNSLSNATTVGGVNDGFVARWDDSGWPALETTGQAINQGVSVVDCNDYAVGDMIGSTITFGSTTISSSQTNSASAYTSDVYLITTDKYASFTNFVPLTSGHSDETSKDLVSSSSFHYVAGSALTGSDKNDVTFVNDATDSYTASSNYGSNAIVIKSDLSGNIGATGGWAATIRPGSGGAANGEGVAVDTSGNVYFCGWYSGTVTAYNAGGTTTGNAGTLPGSSSGSNDIFVIKYNSAGAVQWKKTFGGTGDDKALAISIDPTGSYYYITGYESGSITLAHSHTALGAKDGFVMRGNAVSGGTAINDVYFGGVGNNNVGNDVYSNGITETYVTGLVITGEVYIASYDLTGTTSPSPNWAFNSSGGSVTGNDILLGQNGYVYVSGDDGANTAVTFGSLPSSLSSIGAYVVGLSSWNGVATWESIVFPSKGCYGLAQDIGALATDHGFINLIGGVTPGSGHHAYLEKATEEGLEYSTRLANPSATENNTPVSNTGTSSVYPNPFNNETTLKLNPSIDLSASPVSLVIIDVTGRIVKHIDEITSQETTISSEDLVNGIYFYELIQNGNNIDTGRMIINK